MVNKITYLWAQAKLAQKGAQIENANPVSGFNVGAAVGVSLNNKFYSAAGANRESDIVPMAVHAETSAIERLLSLKPFNIDLVVCTHPSCGSCREEIYYYRTGDNALVAVINDQGDIGVTTIDNYFPTKFEVAAFDEIDNELFAEAQIASALSIPSRYQMKEALPDWGVAIGVKLGTAEEKVFSGSLTGEDAFWSITPAIDAVSKVLHYGREESPQLTDDQVLQQVEQVVFYYAGCTPRFYISGKERQQLSRIPDDTTIYIVDSHINKVFKTTRGQLLPDAFSVESKTSIRND